MTSFVKPLSGFRFAATRRGDTIQQVAFRELGDGARWVDLVNLNALVPPYLTDDATQVSDGVLLTGSQIVVPAATPIASSITDPSQTFLTDLLLVNGLLSTNGAGDFATVTGLDNLTQFLRNLIATEQGELIFHGTYGCAVRRVIGTVNGAVAALLARDYVSSAIQADPRVQSVAQASYAVDGDVLRLSMQVIPISGLPFEFQVGVTSSGVTF